VPLLPPRIGVARADPAVARRVRAEEEVAEWEEKEMRELHSGVANRQQVAGGERAGVHADWPDLAGSHSGALSRVPPLIPVKT
jgi:hypothetical protein